MTQEAFVRVYLSFGEWRVPEMFEPWLFRTTVKAACDYLRRSGRSGSQGQSGLGMLLGKLRAEDRALLLKVEKTQLLRSQLPLFV